MKYRRTLVDVLAICILAAAMISMLPATAEDSIPTAVPATPVPTAVPATPAPTAVPATPAPTAVPATPAPTAAPATPAPTAAPATPAPTAVPATPAPTAVPATPAPTAAPAPPAPTAVPATPAPTAAPATPAPTAAPATPAPTAVPATPGNAEPAAKKLSISLRANCKYAFVNLETASFKASVSGGKAPYDVTMEASGAERVGSSRHMDEAGTWSFSIMPKKYGTLKVYVSVTDSTGQTDTASVSIAAPVRASEPEEEWTADFADLVLTGDWRADLLAIASTQVGYRESSRSFMIDGTGARNGYTRYGDWFGESYMEWCSMFVAFCQEHAGISEEDFPRDMNTAKLKQLLQKRGAYEEDTNAYEPKPGDLVFFNRDDDDRPEHVGFVEKVDDKRVYTIEGNADDAVRRRDYRRASAEIIGYCNTEKLMQSAGYLSDEMLEQLSGEDLTETLKGETTGSGVNVRKSASVQSTLVAQIVHAGTPVLVNNTVEANGSRWYHITFGDIEGYVSGDFIKLYEREGLEQTASADAAAGITLGMNVNLRSRATVESEVLAAIPEEGTRLDILQAEQVEDVVWYLVSYEGIEGYIRGDLLALENP